MRLADDVDAARRLVQEEDRGVLMEKAGQGDLLLVAAGQAGNRLSGARRFDLHFRDPFPPGFPLLLIAKKPRADVGRKETQRQVVGDRPAQSQPFSLSVLAQQADPLPDALPGTPAEDLIPADADPPGLHGVQPEEGAQEFRPSRADQAGYPEDLTTAQSQGHGGRHPLPFELPGLDDILARLMDDLGEKLFHLAADHHFDNVLQGDFFHAA